MYSMDIRTEKITLALIVVLIVYTCTMCRDSLKFHELTHLPVKPFRCSKCNFSAVRKSRLDYHLQDVHEGIRRFKCPICKKVTMTTCS